jgi:hypothetical protein
MHFRHERIDPDPPCGRLTFSLATDLTGNGRDDVVVGGMGSRHHLYLNGARTRLPSTAGLKHRLGFPETNLFWYENPGWERHDVFDAARLGVRAAREVGVTVTGAFDDASASMLGGVTVTDNAVSGVRLTAVTGVRFANVTDQNNSVDFSVVDSRNVTIGDGPFDE